MAVKPCLSDVRQIGPERERERCISGVCSACGTVLLARLEDSEPVNPMVLREKLDAVFKSHLVKHHASDIKTSQAEDTLDSCLDDEKAS